MLNNVVLVGNIVKEPVLRKTSTGQPVVSFRLAVNDSFRRPGPNEDKNKYTLFIDCSLFGPRAETLVKYCKVGSTIGVTGRLEADSYVGRDNVKRNSIRVRCDNFEFMNGSRKSDERVPGAGPIDPEPTEERAETASFDINTEEDLPF